VRALTALAALALCAGCAAATPYQPMGLEGGYSQTRLGADLFTVIFQGNAHLPRRTAESYALYRSAEVSIESGFDYFVVVSGNTDLSPQLLAGREPSPPVGGEDTDYPMVSLIVRGFRGEKPSAQAFNAREVLRELGPTIKRQ
jgi:hypothetical protein